MRKRFLSIAVVLTILLSFIPTNIVFAANGTDVAKAAWKYKGVSRSVYDCSAFVQKAYADVGVSIPRKADEQAKCGEKINTKNINDLQPGDIICFGSSSSSKDITHVGIYYGNDTVLHSSVNRWKIATDTLSSWINSGYYNPPYQFAVRVLSNGVHTHSYSGSYYESAHPHWQYKKCSICGEEQYTGKTQLDSTCPKCYPLGTTDLEVDPQKTKGTATIKWNKVKNATSYKLTVYKDDAVYKTETLSSTTTKFSLTKLDGGTYKAILTIYNNNTNEKPKNVTSSSFKIVDTYSVNYNANGGSGAPSSQLKIKDTDLTLSTTVPSKEGYDFIGWSRTKKATEPEYTAGGKFTLNTKVTLYAVWTPKTYTVNFDANGGNGDTESVSITHGNVIRMPNNIVRNSYYLKGWAKTNDAQTPDYRLGMDYAVTSDMTLYAIWGQSTWDNGTEPFAGGDGTEENPYQIANSKQLAYLAEKVNNQQSVPQYEYYILTDNIDLGYEEWIPIGLYENNNQYFKGNFNGNGYMVSNLSITSLNNKYIGLFGYTKDSEITNLTVSGRVRGNSTTNIFCIGAIAGYSSNLTADKCKGSYINMSVNGRTVTDGSSAEDYSNDGALFGYMEDGTITNCSAEECFVSVKSGTHDFGIIVGGVKPGTVKNCSVKASNDLLGTDDTDTSPYQIYSGAIAGCVTGDISECSVEAESLSNTLTTKGKIYVGGIVGWHEEGTVECCSVKFSAGKLIEDRTPYLASIYAKSTDATVKTHYTIAGGITGVAKLTSKISNCKYEGKSIYSENAVTNAYAGGIIGYDNGLSTNSESGANRCFVNITDGIVYSNSAHTSGAGGIFGRVGNASSVFAPSSNLVTLANKIISKSTGSTYKAYSGDVCGQDTDSGYSYGANTTFYSSSMDIISEAPNSSNQIRTSVGTKYPDAQMKYKSFQTSIFGTPYESINDLAENPENVWVIKEGQYPELYFTVLRDITLPDVEHGAISIDKTQAVDGEIVTVTAEPEDGYTFNKLYVNGEEKVGKTFEVNGDSDVYATFAELPAEYIVEVKATENAAASLINVDEINLQSVSLFSTATSLTATDGEEIRVDTQSDEDYNVEAVYVNGEEMASDSFIITDNSVITMDVKNVSTDVEATTYEAKNVFSSSATLGGYVEDDSDGTSRYILYWKVSEPDEVYTTEVEEGGGEYWAEVTDLEVYEEYEYQMTEFGEVKSFTPEYVPIDETEPEDPVKREICFEIQNNAVSGNIVTADIVNISEESQSGLVIFASYDSSNALVKVETQDIEDLESNGILPIEFDLPEGVDKYKILVWDSWKTMLPIAASVDIE